VVEIRNAARTRVAGDRLFPVRL